MIGHRSIVGICILGALTISAVASQGASAAATGTTAFTCKEVGKPNGVFSDAHCKTKETGGAYKHEGIMPDTTTELKATNVKTGSEISISVFHFTFASLEFELTAQTVEATGEFHNHLVEEDHQVTGTGTVVFKGIKMPNPAGPKGERCVVKTDDGTGTPGAEGIVDTENLKGTTVGQGDKLKLEPAAGPDELFAKFWIQQNPANPEEKCPPNLVKTWPVVGSLVSTSIEGATVNFTRVNTTEQGTLRFGTTEGPKVGFAGSFTFSARANSGESYKPLTPTTTP